MDSLRFHRLAAQEYRFALDWYRKRESSVASRFRDAVDGAVVRILNDPDSHLEIVDGNDTSQQAANAISSTKEKSAMNDARNTSLLNEANAARKWFHAKKTRPIWAKRLELAQTAQTLEGEERVEAAHGTDKH